MFSPAAPPAAGAGPALATRRRVNKPHARAPPWLDNGPWYHISKMRPHWLCS